MMINPDEILPLTQPLTRNACQSWIDRLEAEMKETKALRLAMVEIMAEVIYLRSCHDYGYTHAKWSANENKEIWIGYAVEALK